MLHFSRRGLADLVESGWVREEALEILLLDCCLEKPAVGLRVRLCLADWLLPTLLWVTLLWRRGTVCLLLSILALRRTLTLGRRSWISLVRWSTSAGLNSQRVK